MALRDAREKTGKTQKDVAAELEWSLSKFLRMENGQTNISTTDLQALMRHYGIKEQRQVTSMTEMARDARQSSPFSAYGHALSDAFKTYLEFESSALRIRTFEPLLIPGILQTRDYAVSVVRAYSPADMDESLIQQRVEARRRRQDLLEVPDAPEFYFIIDEAALHRLVGIEADGAGPDTMPEQLEHLKKLNQRPNVRIQVVRYSAGAHRGLTGPFYHLELPPEIQLPDLVYLENARGDAVRYENDDETRQYLQTFFDLEEVATPEEALDDLLDEIIAQQRASAPQIPTSEDPSAV
jgi:transcriptional regulator with XRE-family HTH domain